MAPEGTKSAKRPSNSRGLRAHTVSTRLSRDELQQLTAIAGKRGTAEFMRELILAAIVRNAKARTPDPLLSEIVGVRMLLVNLLQPRDGHEPLTRQGFETLLGEIKRMKKQIALDIERENGRG